LHVHGFCSSYDEVRRYLTSLANHEIDKIKNGVYIPNGIIPFTSAGCLIREGFYVWSLISIETTIHFKYVFNTD
jgi:hypothetical protein